MMTDYKDIGIAYISSYLKQNNCEVLLQYPLEDEIDYEQIIEYQPDYIGLTIYEISKDIVLEAAKRMKEVLPEVKICLGGYYATYNPVSILKKYDFIDYVICGEGEVTWVKLVQSDNNQEKLKQVKGLAFHMENGEVVVNQKADLIADLDTLPYPDRRYLIEGGHRGVAQIITSRGCTSHCSFCSSGFFWKSWRGHSPKAIVDEIESIKQDLGISMLIFLDSSFEDPDIHCKRLRAIATELIHRKVNIIYYVNFRADFYSKVDEELITLLRESGLRGAFIGAEAGNEQDLKVYRKRATLQENHGIVMFLRKYDIDVDLGFINFNPYSTFQTITDNLQYLKKYGFAINIFHITSRYLAYNNCTLNEQIEKDHLFIDDAEGGYNYRFMNAQVDELWSFLDEYTNQLNQITYGLLTKIKFYAFRYLFTLSYLFHEISYDGGNETLLKEIEEARRYNQRICDEYSQIICDWVLKLMAMIQSKETKDELFAVSSKIFGNEQVRTVHNRLYRGKAKILLLLEKYHYDKFIPLLNS